MAAGGFMDPYQRAKTVRIGKWRWPPPKGEEDPNDSFLQFKIRQQSKKMSKQHDGRVGVVLMSLFSFISFLMENSNIVL